MKTNEYGEKWVSGFGGYWNKNWKEGDTIEVDSEEKGEYINFKRPDPIKELKDVVFGLEHAEKGELRQGSRVGGSKASGIGSPDCVGRMRSYLRLWPMFSGAGSAGNGPMASNIASRGRPGAGSMLMVIASG